MDFILIKINILITAFIGNVEIILRYELTIRLRHIIAQIEQFAKMIFYFSIVLN